MTRISKEIMHSHYMTYTAKPYVAQEHQTWGHEIYNFRIDPSLVIIYLLIVFAFVCLIRSPGAMKFTIFVDPSLVIITIYLVDQYPGVDKIFREMHQIYTFYPQHYLSLGYES